MPYQNIWWDISKLEMVFCSYKYCSPSTPLVKTPPPNLYTTSQCKYIHLETLLYRNFEIYLASFKLTLPRNSPARIEKNG